MPTARTHQATAADGVVLRGRVHGQGPPLVFWHGAYGDGDLDWRAMLPYLEDRFTCHLPSWRGRGLSDDHPDLGYGRRVEDVLAYVHSLASPVGLVGWSGGANPALAAAARTESVAALALVEPTMGSVMDDQERTAFGAAVTRLRELAAQGRFSDALRAAASFPFSDDEVAQVDAVGYFEDAARYVPNLLDVFRQLAEWDGPTADDPAVLRTVAAPVLTVHGTDTRPFWVRSVSHVAEHVPDAQTHGITSAGHAVPLTHPEALATALLAFFTRTTPQPGP